MRLRQQAYLGGEQDTQYSNIETVSHLDPFHVIEAPDLSRRSRKVSEETQTGAKFGE